MNSYTIKSFNNELKKYTLPDNCNIINIKKKLHIRDHKINSKTISICIDADEQIIYLFDLTNHIFSDICISVYKNKIELMHFKEQQIDDNKLNVDVHAISYPDDESDFFMSTLNCNTYNMNYETTVLMKSLYDVIFED